MPASGKTPNLGLPQYKPLDTVSMLVTFNGAMATLDTIIQNVKNSADTGEVNIEDLQKDLASLQLDLNTLKNLTQPLATFTQANLTLGPGVIGGRSFTWSNGTQISLVLNVNINLENATVTHVGNNYIYVIATTADDIYNLGNTHNIANAIYVAPALCYGITAHQVNIYNMVTWRDSNITYVGISHAADITSIGTLSVTCSATTGELA